MIPNFRWQIDGKLAGMARPLVGLGTDEEDDLDFLKAEGITAVVSLTERPLSADALDRHGFARLHVPIEDFQPPTMEQVAEFVAWVDERLTEGSGVAVHCLMGQGRTGTMLACYLVSQGTPPDDAIREVRDQLPAAIETNSQERAVHEWWGVLKQGA